TAPSVLTTLQSLIDEQPKHPQFAFKVRSYGFGNDADNIAEQHTWAYGGRLGITVPEWHHLTIGGAGNRDSQVTFESVTACLRCQCPGVARCSPAPRAGLRPSSASCVRGAPSP